MVRTGRDGLKTLCVVMENPSYACKEHADKSVQFIERLVFDKGKSEFVDVGRVIVLNLCSYIQTNDFVGGPGTFDPETDRYLREGIDAAEIILVAWGVTADHRERIEMVKGLIREAGTKEIYIGRKHPSRASYVNYLERVASI